MKQAIRINSLWLALLGAGDIAHADLQVQAQVQTSSSSIGLPASGAYEIDFKANLARIVDPSGARTILNFSSGTAVVLKPAKQTYTSGDLDSLLEGKGLSDSATIFSSAGLQTVGIRPEGGQKQFAGLAATQFRIETQPLPLLTRIVFPLTCSMSSQTVPLSSLTSGGWSAPMSSLTETIGSVAPLALVGLPRQLVEPVTNAMNLNGAFPLSFLSEWPGSAPGSTQSVRFSVTSVESVSLDASVFQIPAGYSATYD